jgi:hypothetical protein
MTEHIVCSVCYNQQVLSEHKTVAQITRCMQAPYKTLLAGGFKRQLYLVPAAVFLA